VAVVQNITGEKLSLWHAGSPPVDADDKVTIPDEQFVDRAWPKSVWKLVTKPKGYADASLDDAYVFLSAPADEDPAPATDAEESA